MLIRKNKVQQLKLQIKNTINYDIISKYKLYTKYNFFLKSGLKSTSTNFLNYNFGWYTAVVSNNLIKRYNINYFISNFNKKNKNYIDNIFSLNNMTLIIKYVKLSRKIRKYTKNKIRYRSFLILLKNRQVFGYLFRLWKLLLINESEALSIKTEFILSLLWDDFDNIDSANPKTIQLVMLEKLVKKKR